MQEAIAKAKVLSEALDYIQRFRHRIVVVKCGGSMMDDEAALSNMLADLAFMNAVGIRAVVVHGGGKAINAAMEKAKLQVQFVQGRRYTDARALAIVEHVLVREINDRMVKTLEALGTSAMPLTSLGSCVLFAEKLFLEQDDRKIDIGMVGRVTDVNHKLIRLLCESDTIPVIAPIARDATGAKLNCNADNAAGEIAAALKAEKLVMVSDTHGIRREPNDENSLMTAASEDEIRQLIDAGVIAGGMLPKVDACLRALDAGVQRAHIIDGKYPHALLLEIFTERGVGTLLSK